MFKILSLSFYIFLLICQPSIQKHVDSRIINGEPASLGQVPWQAALYATTGIVSTFCGGAIISEEWILTSGHCINTAFSVRAYTGLVSLPGGTSSDSSEIIVHEGFDNVTLANDIGLVKLSQPLIFDNNTKPISLARTELLANREVVTSGWGQKSDNANDVTTDLHFVYLKTISNDECRQIYGPVYILDEMVCTVSGTNVVKGPCSGDFGGALVSNFNTEPVLVGISLFLSAKGCEAGEPTGFARINYFRDWILEKTGIE